MALTKAQWYAKLNRWIPRWFWQDEDFNEAVFNGFAEGITQINDEADEHLAQTFIGTATDEFLDQHGSERSLERVTGESDASYRPRIVNLANQSDLERISEMVEGLIAGGTRFRIVEAPVDMPFASRESFCNRKAVTCHTKYNEFSIVIEPQTTEVYAAISAALERMKALGVFCRVIEVPDP